MPEFLGALLDRDQHDVGDANHPGQQRQGAKEQRNQAHARKQQFCFLELLRHGPRSNGPGIVWVNAQARLHELLGRFLRLFCIHAILDEHGQATPPCLGY